MAQTPEKPIVGSLVDSIEKALRDTNKKVGQSDGYHHATEDVIRAPGVSPLRFSDTTWNHLYWLAVPEEESNPKQAKHFRSVLEVFIVGALRGEWPKDPIDAAKVTPRKEDVQYEIAADIKKALLEDFRRTGKALNTDITSTKYRFELHYKFAIVLTRWEIEFDWPISRP